jgi:release factor glutamine methyltransferase
MQSYLTYLDSKLGNLFSSNEKKALSRNLLMHLAGMSSAAIYSDKDKVFSEETRRQLYEAIDRLSMHEPIQYILGETEFCGLRFIVKPSVLIPRPETEELVERIGSDLEVAASLQILDIGTGSGCIAVTLAKKFKHAKVEAWDISEEALETAQTNAKLNNVTIETIKNDILKYNIKTQDANRFRVLVSNPPYVRKCESLEMEKNVLNFEPHIALFVEDTDPLLFYRVIATLGRDLLQKDGLLYFEINSHFGQETIDLVQSLGYKDVLLIQDISGKDRMLKAKL